MHKTLFLLLSASITILSCKKEVTEKPNNPIVSKKRVKKITTSPLDYSTFNYDINGKLISRYHQWEIFGGNGATSALTTQYSYIDTLLKKIQNDAGWLNYYYTNNQLDSIRGFAFNGKYYSTIYPSFNAKKQLISLEEFTPDNERFLSPIRTKLVFQYNAQSNLISSKYYLQQTKNDPLELEQTTMFENYDSEKGAFNFVGFHNESFLFPNIILANSNPTIISIYDMHHKKIFEQRFTYKYDADGLVKEIKVVDDNHNTVTYTYLYE